MRARICYVTPEYPSLEMPDLGRPLYEVIRRIEAPSLVIAPNGPGQPLAPPPHAELLAVPFRDHLLADRRGLARGTAMLGKGFGYAAFLARSVAALRAFEPTVVHLETPMPILHGLFARRVLGARLTMAIIGSDVLHVARSRIWQRLIREADVLLPVARPMRAVLGRAAPRVPLVDAPYGVDGRVFSPGNGSRRRQLVTPAAFRWEKAHGTLIEAFAAVRSRHPDVELLLAGEGYLEARVRALVTARRLGDAVRFVGRLNPAELVSVYRESLATVLSSAHEGLPRVLLESMACGTPVVATRVGGCGDLVQGAGLVVEPADAGALAAAMTAMVADQPRWAAMAGACRGAVAPYDLDRRAEVYRAAFGLA